MNQSRRICASCIYLFALFLSIPAHASMVVWTLNDFTFDDGGTAVGSFTYDADTNTYSNVSITTTPGTHLDISGDAYSVVRDDVLVSPSNILLSLFPTSSGSDLTDVTNFAMRYTAPLTNAGGTRTLLFYTEAICTNEDCTTVWAGGRIGLTEKATITSSVVPIPATVWLFGSGLIGLIGIAKRKKA